MWHPEPAVRHEIPEARWPTREEAARAWLFRPVRVGSVELESRTWVPAMVPWRATEDGLVTRENLDWYGRFAAGRPGALVVEATGIRDVPSGPLLRIGHERFLPGLRSLVERVREESGGRTRLFIQLIDFLSVKRRPEKSKYFERFLAVSDAHRRSLAALMGDEGWLARGDEEVRAFLKEAPDEILELVLGARELEALRFGYRERVTDTHLAHVRELPEVLPGLFAAAARRAREAGFDGVELHYAHAYTMASFLSRLNDRDDGYGRTPEGRVRLPLEVYEAVRREVGRDYTVGVRFLSDEVIEGGSRASEAAFYASEFARAGFDFLSVSKGGKFEDAKQPKVGHAVYPYTGPSGYECMPTVISDERGPFGRNLSAVRDIKRAVVAAGFETPVVAAGGVGTFELAEEILRRGDADIVGAARQSLADPDWFLKARLGRGEEVRRCTYTNYCEALDQMHKQVTCKLWDRSGLKEPGVALSSDGKRRLLPPRWEGSSGDGDD